MSVTDILLSMRPDQAIIRMVNNENGTDFPFESYRISPPRAGAGVRTEVTITAIPSSSDEFKNPYTGTIDFRYNRLHLSDQFTAILNGFRPPMPTTTQVLLNEITRLTGIQFTLEDIVLEVITRDNAAPYRIKAKDESWRWFGFVDATVLDLYDLQPELETLLPPVSGPRLGSLEETPQLTSQPINIPLVNATPYREMFNLLQVGLPAQASPALVWLVKQCVPQSGSRLDQGFASWHCHPVPAAFNLYNATLLRRVEGTSSVNPANGQLDGFLEIQLDPAYCTNFQDPIMQIGYKYDPEGATTFVFDPRLTQVAVVSDTDGSSYAAFLNEFEIGDVITQLVPDWHYYTASDVPWRASVDAPSRTNLYNSVVQYNGQLRPQDIPPEKETMNRVLVVTVSEDNTAYRGNLSIFYMAPVVLPPVIPNGFLDRPYSFALTPTSGETPFTFALLSGAFSVGQSLDSSTGVISGAPKSVGTFRPVIEVMSGAGVRVRYNYAYTVTIAPIAIIGKATNPTLGQPYNYTYTVEGGVGPYTLDLSGGTLGAGMALDRVNHRIVGTPTIAGTHTFALTATDSRGVVSVINDSYQI